MRHILEALAQLAAIGAMAYAYPVHARPILGPLAGTFDTAVAVLILAGCIGAILSTFEYLSDRKG